MINGRHRAKELHEEYRRASPFPHIVVEDFFASRYAEVIAEELEAEDLSTWSSDEHPDSVNKRYMDRPDRLPPMTGAALRFLNTPYACRFFSELTGIDDLEPDPSYFAGGVHATMRGGWLTIHSDFNLHPSSGLHRRVNALVFLNKNWDPSWKGQLQLWAKDLTRPVVTVNPDFNRLVCFTITDDAFHGVPTPLECPPERKRFSLALYYYTQDRPEAEKAPFHWALWQRVSQS